MNRFRNPSALATPGGFSHVVESTCRRTIHVSGQVAYDAAGQVVGVDDLAAQVHQVYANLRTALAEFGATMNDVVKTTLYVKDLSPERVAVIRRVRAPFLDPSQPPASTLIGVQALARPELMLEVEAIAMLD